MGAIELEITARKKEIWGFPAGPADFEFKEKGAADPGMILTNPLASLYCLDHAERRAIFVETPPGLDLSQAPFYYYAQYEHAVKGYAVPYESLHEIADKVDLDDARVILVYSTGRAGSTLMGAALNAAEGILGLSEPDVFTQLVVFRLQGSDEAEIIALARSCLKILCKPTEQVSHPSGYVIKFRSFCIELADLLYQLLPKAKILFLYRHAASYVNSAIRAFGSGIEDDPAALASFQAWLSTLVPPIAEHMQAGGGLLSPASMAVKGWLRTLAQYMACRQAGMPGLAVRYENLKADPRQVIQEVFKYCGLPSENMAAVYEVLSQDSQAGSDFSQDALSHRTSGLTESQLADLAHEMENHPSIHLPDIVVPGTLKI